MECTNNCQQQTSIDATIQAYQVSKLDIGLGAIGSASGLIYGVASKKRWWVVILLMIGGGAMGRGVGYAVDSFKR